MKQNTDPVESPPRQQTGHTPEPWDQDPTGDMGFWIIGTVEKPVCEILDQGEMNHDEEKANSERIVSCVNACAGIQNPAAIKQLIEAAKELPTRSHHTSPPDYSWSQCVGCDREEGHDPNCPVVVFEQALAAL